MNLPIHCFEWVAFDSALHPLARPRHPDECGGDDQRHAANEGGCEADPLTELEDGQRPLEGGWGDL